MDLVGTNLPDTNGMSISGSKWWSAGPIAAPNSGGWKKKGGSPVVMVMVIVQGLDQKSAEKQKRRLVFS